MSSTITERIVCASESPYGEIHCYLYELRDFDSDSVPYDIVADLHRKTHPDDTCFNVDHWRLNGVPGYPWPSLTFVVDAQLGHAMFFDVKGSPICDICQAVAGGDTCDNCGRLQGASAGDRPQTPHDTLFMNTVPSTEHRHFAVKGGEPNPQRAYADVGFDVPVVPAEEHSVIKAGFISIPGLDRVSLPPSLEHALDRDAPAEIANRLPITEGSVTLTRWWPMRETITNIAGETRLGGASIKVHHQQVRFEKGCYLDEDDDGGGYMNLTISVWKHPYPDNERFFNIAKVTNAGETVHVDSISPLATADVKSLLQDILGE